MVDPLAAQRALQIEADAVVRDLQLDELLGALGRPVRVGSSAMGLMVRRDIDITTICSKLDADAMATFAGIAARLMQDTQRVGAVRFRNDCGSWNIEPVKYPDGLYLGLTVRAEGDAIWTVDIWLVDEPARQPDLAHLESLLPRLTDEIRRTILQIKQVLAGRPAAAIKIPSVAVYEAVLDHGIETIAQFDDWHRARG